MSSDQYVQVPANSTGVKLRTRRSTVGLDDVDSEVMVLEDGNGNLLIPMSEAGTCKVSAGTIGVSMGTLQTLTQVGTLPTLGTMGTLYYLAGLGMGTVVIASGTLTGSNPSAGTLDTLTQIGTLPNLIVGSGTLQAVSAAYLAGAGTLQTVTQIGTLPNIVVGSGTLQQVTNAFLAGAGTLRTVTQIGTLPNVIVGSGTIQTLSAGSLQYIGSIGTLPNIIVGSGTLQSGGTVYGLTQGTLNSVGSVSVYSKHDLHDYHAVGTVISTSGGTIAQTASKIIKVHHYRAQTDGSYAFEFTDTKPAGGTVDAGWYFTQREGVVAPFTPYPAYLFKTSTAGSGLVVGTWPSSVCSGTLRLSIVYTDDDTS